MATTYLTSLEFEGLKSFADKASIVFPANGLVLIKGTRDDGISSGTGKSTLLAAITHALKYCPESGTELQSWLTDKALCVKLGLRQGGKESLVTRGPKASLKIGDDKPVTGASAIDSHLESFIGLPPELLAALTYREQKKPGLFLSKGDQDKKTFLSLILGLTAIEDQVEASQERIKKMDNDLTALAVKGDLLSAQLRSLQATRPSCDMADVEALEISHRELRNQYVDAAEAYHKARKDYEDYQKAVDAGVSAIQKDAVAIVKALESAIQAAEAGRPVFVPDTTDVLEANKVIVQVEERLKKSRASDSEVKRSIQSKLELLKRDVWARKQKFETIPALENKIDGILHNRKCALQNKCPTCQQAWQQDGAVAIALLADAEDLDKEVGHIRDQFSEVASMEAEIKTLQAEFATPDPIIPQLEAIKREYENRRMSAEGAQELKRAEFYSEFDKTLEVKRRELTEARNVGLQRVYDCQAYHKPVADALTVTVRATSEAANDIDRRSTEMKGRIDTARATNRMKVEAVEAHSRREEVAQAAVDAARGAIDAKAVEINAERDFIKLVGREGFLGNIFSEVLIEIATETNKILKSVPNVAHVTLKFKNETTTQKGSTKKVITPVLNIAGVERALGSALSGGMRTAVDLAVDLATRRVVSRRSGHNPAWLILDECMEGLSSIEKECVMHILKQFATDTLILVVDHASEFKELFTKIVEVKYDRVTGRSTLK